MRYGSRFKQYLETRIGGEDQPEHASGVLWMIIDAWPQRREWSVQSVAAAMAISAREAEAALEFLECRGMLAGAAGLWHWSGELYDLAEHHLDTELGRASAHRVMSRRETLLMDLLAVTLLIVVTAFVVGLIVSLW